MKKRSGAFLITPGAFLKNPKDGIIYTKIYRDVILKRNGDRQGVSDDLEVHACIDQSAFILW